MSRKNKTPVTEKQAHRNLLIATALLNITMVILIAYASIFLYSRQVRESRTMTAQGAAQISALIIEGDRIDGWLQNGPDEFYDFEKQELEGIKRYTPYLEYLYVYQIREDGCHVVFDTDSGDVLGEPLGTFVEFDDAFLPYIETLLNGGRIDPIESRDKYGWLLTFYEPVYDSSQRVVAYVGADMSMIEIRNYINQFILLVTVISVLFLGICIYIDSKMSIDYYNNDRMEKLLAQQKRDKQLLRELSEAFARVIDLKDSYTQGHSVRVAKYTALLAKELGYDDDEVENFYTIALLHDIGKIGIPGKILNKPDRLSDKEFEIMKSHTSRGYTVLKDISLLPEISDGALYHHERPDGKGYPQGLKGDEIPRVAQIIAVADTFDAMYSNRKYRTKMNFDRIVSIIDNSRGTQLTPDVVDAFLRLVDKGEFRDPEDQGGGSTEEIENI